jgi:carbon-monoxide dehydrogenase medium subunit
MQYYAPKSFSEAIEISMEAKGITRFLAGGTDVLVQLRADILTPEVLIDIKKIPEVGDILQNSDGSWRIGAAVPGAQLNEHKDLKAQWPGVVEAMDLIGSTQVQGRATLVGNLCNGSPAADSVPALIAAGASVTIISPNGSRDVSVEDIPHSPGKTTLEKGELISAINLPKRNTNGGDAYLRLIPRTEMDIAVVGCGINLSVKEGLVSDARVSLGAVTAKVILVKEAADAIIGTSLDDKALTALSLAASAACKPINDKRGTIEYRTHVAGVLAKRAAQIAYKRARS